MLAKEVKKFSNLSWIKDKYVMHPPATTIPISGDPIINKLIPKEKYCTRLIFFLLIMYRNAVLNMKGKYRIPVWFGVQIAAELKNGVIKTSKTIATMLKIRLFIDLSSTNINTTDVSW